MIIFARRLGTRLMRKTMKRAIEYEVNEIAMLCSLALRHDSLIYGDLSKFNRLDNTYNLSLNKLMAEAEAERLYHSLLIQFVKSGAVKSGQVKQAREAVEKIAAIKEKYDSFTINHSYLMVSVMLSELNGDYATALSLCDNFEAYFLKQKKLATYIRHADVLLQKLDCCLYLSDFEKGQQCAEKALSFYREGEGNWYACQEAYFLLSLRTANLDRAADIYISVIKQPKFRNLVWWRKERWELFSGYLWSFLEIAKRHDLKKKLESSAKQFKLSRMLNDIPTYSADKEGYNIAILILQIIGLIVQDNYTEVISRMESLNNYVYKNLHRDPAHIRSQIFMKMLISLVKADFDPTRIRRRTERYLEVLKKTPLRYNASQVYIEVIPFEDLWEMVEESLAIHASPQKKFVMEEELVL
jgi:tetratricopeptide (TPR) repeat protein